MEKIPFLKEYTFHFFLMLKNNIKRTNTKDGNMYIAKNGLIFTDKDEFFKNYPSDVFISLKDIDTKRLYEFKKRPEESEDRISENKKSLSEITDWFKSLFPEKKAKEVTEPTNKNK